MSQKFLSDVVLSTLTAGSILKLDANGKIVEAVDGTDYISSAATGYFTASSGSGIYYSGDVRIGTYQTTVAPDAKLHIFDYQTTEPKLLIEDGNTGDASMQFKVSTQSYTIGIDNSNSDKFVLSAGSELGTGNLLEITSGGLAAFQNSVLLKGTLYVNNQEQIQQGATEKIATFQNLGTERGYFEVTDTGKGYFYADGFKTGATTVGFLKSDGTVDTGSFFSGAYGDLTGTPTLGTMAAANTSDYKTSDEVETYVAGELTYTNISGTPTLGTAAATDSTDYATAAQGALADSALQSLPSHNHDGRYYTKTESDGKYAVSGDNFVPIVANDSNYQQSTEGVVLATNNTYVGLAFPNGGKNFVFEVSIKGDTNANHQGIFWGLDTLASIYNNGESGYKLTHQGEQQLHIRDIATNTNQLTYQAPFTPNDRQWHRYKLIQYFNASEELYVFKVYIDGVKAFDVSQGQFNAPPQQPTYFGFINYTGDVEFSNWNVREITGEEDLLIAMGEGLFQPVGDYLTSLPAHHHDARYYTETEMDTFLSGKLSTSGGTLSGGLTINEGNLRIIQDVSNIAQVTLGEDPNGNHVILEYDGTGSGATNYFYLYSGLSSAGWAEKGTSLNMQPSTGKIAIGTTTFTEKFNVDGNVRFTGTISASGYNKTNWDTAYGWGNHADAGYLTALPSHNHDGRYYTETEADSRFHRTGTPLVLDARGADIGGSASYVTGGSGDSSLESILNHVALNLNTAGDEPTTIYFKSGVNEPSDFAYISFLPNKAGTSEEAVLQIGVENDGAGSSDYIRLQGRVSTVVDYVSSEASVIQDWVYVGTQKASIDISGNLQLDGTITASGYNKSNWDTAYGWGNHASAGYITSADGGNAATLDGIDSTGFVKQLADTGSPDYLTPSSRRVNPNASNPTNAHYAITTFGNGGNVTGQLATHFQTGKLYSRGHNASWSAWNAYATESYVNTAVSNLVASAPAALNTLNELAAALGDDANFSTTVTNNIGAIDTRINDEVIPYIASVETTANAALPKSGGTMTGDLNLHTLNQKLSFSNTAGQVSYISHHDSIGQLTIASDNVISLRETDSNVVRHTFTTNDGNYTATGVITASGGNSGQWNTAYGWGNHASAGYLTSIPSSYATDAEVSSAVGAIETSINERIDTEVFDAIATVDGNIPTNNNQLTNGAGYITGVNWTQVGAGQRTNYDLDFRPPTGGYAGFRFTKSDGNNAGYFLVRGTSDNGVYKANGITLVADGNWLTLAQRTSSAGVRIMTGTTSQERLIVRNDGSVAINPTSSWNSTNAALTIGSGGDGRIQTRHIWGKNSVDDTPDDLWLNYANAGKHVQIGQNGGGNNLYVAGDIYMNGYFNGNKVATESYADGAAASVNDRIDTEVFDAIATVDGNIPTNNNQLTNGAGYITAVPSTFDATSIGIGSKVTISESTDRADLLYINSHTSGWGGLQIGNTSNEFIFSLMGNGNAGGIYDDQNGDWIIYWDENAGLQLKHNSSTKLTTTSTGITITGEIVTTGGNSTNWNTAYGWGNHASAGYLKSIPSTYVQQTQDIVSGNIHPVGDREQLLGLDSNRWQVVFCEILDSAGQHEKNLQNPEGEKSVGEYETGTVLVWKGGKNVPCTEAADHMRMGIAVKGISSPLIQGAEPVLVTGSVKEGDYLVTSRKEGHAEAISPEFMRQHGLYDCVLGKALESAEGESHLVKTWINI